MTTSPTPERVKVLKSYFGGMLGDHLACDAQQAKEVNPDSPVQPIYIGKLVEPYYRDLLAILDAYPALVEENERFKKACLSYFRGEDGLGTCGTKCQWHPKDGTLCPMSREGLLSDLKTAKSELATAQAVNAKNGAVIVEQMAELERVRPLVEAAEKADLFHYENGDVDFEGDHQRSILRAALALRQAEGEKP